MPVGPLAGRAYFHISRVVADLDSALDRFGGVWDVGRWRIYTLGPENVVDLSRGGAAARFSIRLAITDLAPQLELIQPLGGPSLYADWLAERGEAPHHVGVLVESVGATVAAMAEAGFDPIVWARGYGGSEWAYFDTVREVGLAVEAVQPPTEVPEPDAVWPGGS